MSIRNNVVSVAVLLWCLCAVSAQAQDPRCVGPEPDPVMMLSPYCRSQMQEINRRQQEAQDRRQDYEDRQTCLRAGYRGPAVDDCLRDIWERRLRALEALERSMPPSVTCDTMRINRDFSTTDCY
jgi:hypothetical protein